MVQEKFLNLIHVLQCVKINVQKSLMNYKEMKYSSGFGN